MTEPLIEFAPELEVEAEVTVEAIPQIGAVVVLAVALGMILAADAICRAFFGTLSGSLGWIPYLNKVVETPIAAIKRKVISFLSGIEHDIDSSMGRHFHLLEQDVSHFIRSLEDMAVTVILLGALAAGATATYVIGPLTRWIHGIIRKVEEEIRTLEREVIKQGAHVERITVHNIFPRIQGATTKVERFVEHAIQPIEQTAHDAERIAVRAEKGVRRLERQLGKKAFLAALVGAIGTLAVDALKCSQLGNLFKNRGCSLWSELEKLLGLFADVLIFANVCAILDFLSPLVSDIAAPIVTALTDVGAGLCKGGIGAPGVLQGQVPTIPAQYTGTPGLPS